MSGVILPGRYGLVVQKQMTGVCAVCEVPFYGQRDMQNHFGHPRHEEAVQGRLEEERRRKARLAFMHEDPDPEVTKHLEGVGKRMLREGRWVVKPNERAGFS